MRTILIENVEEFGAIYEEFKTTSVVKNNPRIYHVGIDIEYITSDYYVSSYNNIKNQKDNNYKLKVCYINISNENMILLINIAKFVFIPSTLRIIICSEHWIKTGVGIDLDIHYLMNIFGFNGTPAYIDIKTMELIKGTTTNPNLENLISIYLGEKYKKVSSAVCDWSGKLDYKHYKYMIQDAFYSYALGREYIPTPKYFEGKIFLDDTEEINIERLNIPENYTGRMVEYFQRIEKRFPEIQITTNLSTPRNENENFIAMCRYNDKLYSGIGRSKTESRQNLSKEFFDKM